MLFAYNAHASTLGVIGGSANPPNTPGTNTPYGALLTSSLVLQPVPSSLLPTTPDAFINGVAINNSGFSALVGHDSLDDSSYCLLYDSSGNPTLAQPQIFMSAYAVATNNSSNSIMVGSDDSLIFAKVGPTGAITAIHPGSGSFFNSTAINDSGLATATGSESYIIFSDNTALHVQGNAASTSINTAGNSIFVGNNQCTLYNSSGTQIAQTSITDANLFSVSLTDTDVSLIGGTLQSVHPYAAYINLAGNVTPIASSSLPNLGRIASVSFSEMGIGIIGGQTSTGAYAAYLYPNGSVQSLQGLPTGPDALINSVSINDWGMALLGGTTDGTNAYAALATPWGQVIPLLNNSPSVVIRSVAITNFVPTMLIPAITGNNLLFAQYLNRYARKKLFYFLPSLSEETFPAALQLAAPTRNALSLFSVANNFFFLNHSLSAHLRNYRHTSSRFTSRQAEISLLASGLSRQSLADSSPALNTLLPQNIPPPPPRLPPKKLSYSLWFQTIGAYINQKEQDETVANNPAIGGAVLAFEPLRTEQGRFGLGAAYTFTRIHEHQGAGSSYINQEYAFLYGSWANHRCYFDAAVWGGLFQTRQTRQINIPGFSFHASSRPTGYEVSPHAELGCSKPFRFGAEKQHQFTLDLFGMADWPIVWQSSYKESGNGPFNARQTAQYASFLRAETGFRFYETFTCQSLLFTLQEKISYVYKHPFHIGTIAGALVGSPGSFTLESFTATQNLGAAELTFIFEPLNPIHPRVSLSFQGEYGSTYNSQQITFDLAWNF